MGVNMKKTITMLLVFMFMATTICNAGGEKDYPVWREKGINNQEVAKAFFKHMEDSQNVLIVREFREKGGFYDSCIYDCIANDYNMLSFFCKNGYVMDITLHMQQEEYIRHGIDYLLALLTALDFETNNSLSKKEVMKVIDKLVSTPLGQEDQTIYNAKTKRMIILSKNVTYGSRPLVYFTIKAKQNY